MEGDIVACVSSNTHSGLVMLNNLANPEHLESFLGQNSDDIYTSIRFLLFVEEMLMKIL